MALRVGRFDGRPNTRPVSLLTNCSICADPISASIAVQNFPGVSVPMSRTPIPASGGFMMNSWQAALDARPRLRRAIVPGGPRQLWRRESGPGRNVPLVLLDFHQCRVRNTALGQSRGPFVQGQNVHIAMLVESVDFAWMLRVIPTAFAYQDNAGPNSVGQGSASECQIGR